MTACDRAESLFGRAWDDELTALERDGLEVHFAACSACRREYDELARTLELVQALPRPAVDEGFAARVVAEAHRRELAGEGVGRRIEVFAWPRKGTLSRTNPWLVGAAAAVLVVGIGSVLRTGTVPVPSLMEESATVSSAPAPAPTLTVVAPPEPVVAPPVADEAPAPAPTTRVARRTVAPATALAASDGPTIADSLFDHSADVELVLDPVQLRRERGRGYTPTSPAVRGEAASITF